MLLSQKLADFSKGDADVLRKAMGKKQRDVLDKMKPKFIAQAAAKGHPEDKLEKIWKDWEAFASTLSTNRILPVMPGLPTKRLISRRITRPNIWPPYSLTT
jgi:glutamine synthetase adenylyltransferase